MVFKGAFKKIINILIYMYVQFIYSFVQTFFFFQQNGDQRFTSDYEQKLV